MAVMRMYLIADDFETDVKFVTGHIEISRVTLCGQVELSISQETGKNTLW